jgi:hypothetical protein
MNMFAYSTYTGFQGIPDAEQERILINIDTELSMALEPRALIDHFDLLLLSGGMSDFMKSELQLSIEAIPDTAPEFRVLNTLFLILASPQFAVQQ